MQRPALVVLCAALGAGHAAAEDRRTERFDAQALSIQHVTGSVRIDTAAEGGPIVIAVSGAPEAVASVKIRKDGDTAVIEQQRTRTGSTWFDLSWIRGNNDDSVKVVLEITAPRTTAVATEALIGNISIGDLDAPLKLGLLAADGEVGAVRSAEVDIAGAGNLSIGSVERAARLSIKGGGDVRVGRAGGADVNIAGAGDVSLGDVSGPFSASIAGGGDVRTGAVSGPVSISIAGAGEVAIASGRADPFSVSIVGAGSVDFGGEAVNPQISAVGSGDVRMRSYSGNLHSSGMVSVRTGD